METALYFLRRERASRRCCSRARTIDLHIPFSRWQRETIGPGKQVSVALLAWDATRRQQQWPSHQVSLY